MVQYATHRRGDYDGLYWTHYEMVISRIRLVIRDKQDAILTKRIEDKLKIVYRKRRELVGKQVPSYFHALLGGTAK